MDHTSTVNDMADNEKETVDVFEGTFEEWVQKALPYLQDYHTLLSLMGNHSAATPLKLLIDKAKK